MSERRPNLVLVHCHDLGQHLHCYGVDTVRTPHLDAFAADGVRFARSFCSSPSCSPSRASLFTGRWPHNNGVMGLCHANFAWELNPDERHLAQLLREAGWRTHCCGVLHESRAGGQRCGYEAYQPGALATQATDNALAYLDGAAARDEPFCLVVGFIEPHRLRDRRLERGLPNEQSFPGDHLEPDSELGVQIPPFLRDTPDTRAELAGLQGAVRHIDEQFQRIRAKLAELGLEQNTLLEFTTDHGIAMPRAKCSVYEPGVSIAKILRLPSRPGWSGGRVVDEMVSNVDDLPSILEALGVTPPDNLHGRSFAPLLDGRDYRPREVIPCEMTYHDFYDPRRSLRTERWKIIANFTTAQSFMDPSQRWRPLSDPVVPQNRAVSYHSHLELYDLDADPWEQRNLAAEADHAETLRAMSRRLYQHLVETDDPILRGAITGPHHRTTVGLLAEASR